MADSDLDLDADWAALRTGAQHSIEIPKKNLQGLMDMAMAKTQADLRAYMQKAETPSTDALPELVAKGVSLFWGHLTKEARGVDPIGMIEIILSAQHIPAPELKGFVRAIPITLLRRVLESHLGAQAGGIHALLSLEVMVREGRENDYTLTALSDGIEVSVRVRARDNEVLAFRLDESFAAPPKETQDEATFATRKPLPQEPEAPRRRDPVPPAPVQSCF